MFVTLSIQASMTLPVSSTAPVRPYYTNPPANHKLYAPIQLCSDAGPLSSERTLPPESPAGTLARYTEPESF